MESRRPKPSRRGRRWGLAAVVCAALSSACGAAATPTSAPSPKGDLAALGVGDPVVRWTALRAWALAPPVPPPAPEVLHLSVVAPGLEVAEVEAQVGAPLIRAAAQALPDHRGLDSVARPGQFTLAVALAPGAGESARRTLADAVRAAALAAHLEAPLLRRVSPTAEVAFVLPPEADGAAVLRALARLPGVGAVADCGFEPADTTVWVDPARLPASHAGLAEVARAIEQAQATRRSDLAELVLAVRPDGVPVKLAAVATLAPSDETACRCTVAGAAARCVTVSHHPAAGPTADAEAWAAALGAAVPVASGARYRLDGALDHDGRASALARAVNAAAPEARLEVQGERWRIEAPAATAEALARALAGRVGITPGIGRLDGEPAATVWVVGAEAEALAPVARRVAEALRAAGAREAAVVASPARPSWSLVTDRAQLAAFGVGVGAVAQAVRAALVGIEVSRYGAPSVWVRWAAMRAPAAGPGAGPGAADPGAADPGAVDPGAADPGAADPGAADPPETVAHRIRALPVPGPQGRWTTVGALARLEMRAEPAARFQRDGQPAVPVAAMGLAQAAVTEGLASVPLPEGVRLEVAPTAFELPWLDSAAR